MFAAGQTLCWGRPLLYLEEGVWWVAFILLETESLNGGWQRIHGRDPGRAHWRSTSRWRSRRREVDPDEGGCVAFGEGAAGGRCLMEEGGERQPYKNGSAADAIFQRYAVTPPRSRTNTWSPLTARWAQVSSPGTSLRSKMVIALGSASRRISSPLASRASSLSSRRVRLQYLPKGSLVQVPSPVLRLMHVTRWLARWI